MTVTIGILLGLLAMACWGMADFFVAHSLKKTGAMAIFFWSQLIGAVLLLAALLALPVKIQFTLQSVIILAACSLLNIAAYLAFYHALKVDKLSIISPVVSSWAAVTVILSLIFLGESLLPKQAVGVMVLIAGAVLASFKLDELKNANASRGLVFAFIAVISWGLYYTLIKAAVIQLGWLLAALTIKTLMGLFLVPYVMGCKKDLAVPREAHRYVLIVGVLESIGLVAYGIGTSAYLASIVAPVSATSPMLTVILAALFLKETTSPNQKLGIAAIIAGLVILSL